MHVYVLNQSGKPLMPCSPAIARLLLKDGKAKVARKTPFTIQLLCETSEYKQPVTAGMDSGSTTIGCAAIANNRVLYQSEVKLHTGVSKKMQQRAMYRRNRRGRKCRYRPARWANRSSMRREGRLAPSIHSKVDSHLREKKHVENLLPVTHWKVETASFDIHKMSDPDVSGVDYQKGQQKGFYNIKTYVLHRDNYKCQSGRKCTHSQHLHVHHIIFRSQDGTNTPSNLITLCKKCHTDLHSGKFELKIRKPKTKHATEMGIIKTQLKKIWDFEETFGYETKFKRETVLLLPKTHYFDAVAICCKGEERIELGSQVFLKRHIASGDYQQTKGIRSEKRIPIGKLFGLKKHDLVQTKQGTGFVKGKRSSGYFALETIFGEKVHVSANVKKGTLRLVARSTTLIQQMRAAIPPGAKAPSFLAVV